MPHVIICLIVNPERSKVLLFRRAAHKIFPGKFAPVAAGPYAETENFREKASEEIKNETGTKAEIVLEAPVMNFEIEKTQYVIHPYLVEVKENTQIILNEEHTSFRWVPLFELGNPEYDQRFQSYVPKLLALEQLGRSRINTP